MNIMNGEIKNSLRKLTYFEFGIYADMGTYC